MEAYSGVWRHGAISNKRSQRRRTWDLLRHLAMDSNLPWCMIGDMNNVISHEDIRGANPYPRWLMGLMIP